jgi:hypothetical protein
MTTNQKAGSSNLSGRAIFLLLTHTLLWFKLGHYRIMELAQEVKHHFRDQLKKENTDYPRAMAFGSRMRLT